MNGAQSFSQRKRAAMQSAPPPSPPLPDSMGQWLGRLTLLEGIPFTYLVPKADMLPPESIRFFYVDRNWLDSLIDGAFSVGQYSSRDAMVFSNASPTVKATAARYAAWIRSHQPTGTPPPETDPGGIMTGFLLRSSVVSNFPGMQVKAFFDMERTDPVSLFRLEVLSKDVMIGIWGGLPAVVDFDEPPEVLRFGAIAVSDPPGYQIALRSLITATISGFPFTPGGEIEDPEPVLVPVPFRAANAQVVDVTALQAALQQALVANGGMQGTALTPQGFAIQLVQAAESQTFERLGGS